MNTSDIRFLFGYDRWATRKVLDASIGVDPSVWGATSVVGERGLGTILVHMLGAHQRWRHSLQRDGLEPEPEAEPLPSVDELRGWWDDEHAAMAAWLETIDDDFLAYVHEGVVLWQMLLHLANHGTQHRSEAAVLLTGAGCSPGDLDLIDFAEAPAGIGR